MKYLLIFILIFSATLTSCGSSNDSGIFDEPILIAIDSENNRLFVLEKNGLLSILNASNRNAIGKQPFVNKKREVTIHNLLPSSPTNLAVIDSGTTSRLFIIGVQIDTAGNTVLNQILVLDFDGANLSIASISPIVVDDGDGATDDTDNILGGLEVDTDNDRLYVTDATAGALYSFNTNDGSEDAAALSIDGTPNKMSLDGARLYVANATSTAADQVITVVNTNDFSTTEIDLGFPTDDIAVLSNGTGTALLAKRSNEQQVSIHEVDTSTFASSSAIPVSNSSAVNGALISGKGITSAVGQILLTKLSSGKIFGYVPQSDGTIEVVTILADLSSFTAAAISTVTAVLEGIDVLLDSSGNGVIVYIAASASGDLVFTDAGSTSGGARF